MLVIQLLWPNFALHWVLAVSGTLVAWVMVLVSRLSMPQTMILGQWRPEIFFSSSPALLANHQVWSFAVALVTLALAVLLTEVARVPETDWQAWGGTMALAALGLLSVYAANPLTLLLAWAALDVTEVVLLIRRFPESRQRERVVVSFAARVGGMAILLWAALAARFKDALLTFDAVTSDIGIYLLLSAGLRLGVLPPHVPFTSESPLRRGFGTMVRLVPAASSLVLLTRMGDAGVSQNWMPYLLSLAAIAAVYGSFTWVGAENELDGRPYWILGVGSLSIASAILARPVATTSWSVVLLFSGGLLFLTSLSHQILYVFPLLALLALSGLPFTPTWDGTQLFNIVQPTDVLGTQILYLVLFGAYTIAHAALIAGFARHVLREDGFLTGVERWVWVIYPIGLGLLPVTHFGITWWTGLGIFDKAQNSSPFPWGAGWWVGIISVGLAALVVYWTRRDPHLLNRTSSTLAATVSFDWFYRFIWWSYRAISRFVTGLDSVLEGDGGILWALLMLTLLLTFLFRRNGGG